MYIYGRHFPLYTFNFLQPPGPYHLLLFIHNITFAEHLFWPACIHSLSATNKYSQRAFLAQISSPYRTNRASVIHTHLRDQQLHPNITKVL